MRGRGQCDCPPSAVPRPAHRMSAVSTAPARKSITQAPCRRCQLSGQPCVFEKPEKKNGQQLSTTSVECARGSFSSSAFLISLFFLLSHRRLSRLESQYVVRSIPLFLPSPLLSLLQGHAKPNDWSSNVARPHSCCGHTTRRSRCHASWSSHLSADDPRRSWICHKCVRNPHRSRPSI